MKIVSIVGARPQFIKLGPLSRELRKTHEEIIIHTGQHFDHEMSQLFFDDLKIAKPDFNLSINGGKHGEQTGRMIIELEKVISNVQPDLVLVFGDTNSTLAASIASSKIDMKTIHIEAGLRSFNKKMPEEINRIVSDHISDFLFAPTKTAVDNLKNEGLFEKTFYTGDIMTDSLKYALNIKKKSEILEQLNINFDDYFLCTLHRPYNVDNPDVLNIIISELGKLSQKVIFPVHPRTRKILFENNIVIPENIKLIDPVGYIEFCNLQANSKKIITDSGGVQKEAYMLKKPCITLRSETEWLETVESGWNLLLNPVSSISFAESIENFVPPENHSPIFGIDVAAKMNEVILKLL